uniref:Mitochondrial zinc maintenance protein 1, mitochondrial n=1 Tax=Steinernema glaseri TaxID=37863 RepID=A0A1I7XZI3_9BILA
MKTSTSLKAFRKLFEHATTGSEGTLSVSEAKKILRQYGEHHGQFHSTDVKKLLEKRAQKNEVVTFEDCLYALHKLREPAPLNHGKKHHTAHHHTVHKKHHGKHSKKE